MVIYMKILVIDAQGGGIGRQLVALIKQNIPNVTVTAVGADYAATGENAVIVGCRQADIIVGPIGIVIADSLLGEVTPNMTLAVAQSRAKRILIPFRHCDNIIAGISDYSTGKLVQNAIEEIQKILTTECT